MQTTQSLQYVVNRYIRFAIQRSSTSDALVLLPHCAPHSPLTPSPSPARSSNARTRPSATTHALVPRAFSARTLASSAPASAPPGTLTANLLSLPTYTSIHPSSPHPLSASPHAPSTNRTHTACSSSSRLCAPARGPGVHETSTAPGVPTARTSVGAFGTRANSLDSIHRHARIPSVDERPRARALARSTRASRDDDDGKRAPFPNRRRARGRERRRRIVDRASRERRTKVVLARCRSVSRAW